MDKILLTIFFLFINMVITYGQKVVETPIGYYNAGVDFLEKGDYVTADSLFTLSLNLEYSVDAFYNRALARKTKEKLRVFVMIFILQQPMETQLQEKYF